MSDGVPGRAPEAVPAVAGANDRVGLRAGRPARRARAEARRGEDEGRARGGWSPTPFALGREAGAGGPVGYGPDPAPLRGIGEAATRGGRAPWGVGVGEIPRRSGGARGDE